MNIVEFYDEIKKLELAFDRPLKKEQRDLWFEKFERWPRWKLNKVIDSVIDESERFPPIAALMKRGETIQDKPALTRGTRCEMCDSYPNEPRGTVTAIKDGYKTTFRCHCCRNWEGRFSESIPVWSQYYEQQGYRLETLELDATGPRFSLKNAKDLVASVTESAEDERAKEWKRKKSLDDDEYRDIFG